MNLINLKFLLFSSISEISKLFEFIIVINLFNFSLDILLDSKPISSWGKDLWLPLHLSHIFIRQVSQKYLKLWLCSLHLNPSLLLLLYLIIFDDKRFEDDKLFIVI